MLPDSLCSLSFNDLGAEGAAALAPAIAANASLTKISLASNPLEEHGTKVICDALKSNTILKELNLNGHSSVGWISTRGAKHVAEMLLVNASLAKLTLAKNKLEKYGTKAICDALKVNKTLKELDLSGDPSIFGSGSNIGGSAEAGAKHVADMLGINDSLTVCNLLGNSLDAEAAKLLVAAVHVKDISVCGITRDRTEADFSDKSLGHADAVLVASDLSKAGVTASLTSVNPASEFSPTHRSQFAR